jgi:hypothetical protein
MKPRFEPVKVKKLRGGKFALDILCEHCGKPITKSTKNFGMDCEDDCARKAYIKSGGPARDKKLLALVNKIAGTNIKGF